MDKHLFYLCAIVFGILTAVLSLHCQKCNEMVIGRTSCKNVSKENCEKKFPQQQSICLKTIQKFSKRETEPHWTLWIYAECQISEVFESQQIDNCTKTNFDGGSLTSCTCTQDLCDAFALMDHENLTSLDHGEGRINLIMPENLANGTLATSGHPISVTTRPSDQKSATTSTVMSKISSIVGPTSDKNNHKAADSPLNVSIKNNLNSGSTSTGSDKSIKPSSPKSTFTPSVLAVVHGSIAKPITRK